ncbi:MAG TPA: hypothetical protein VMW75_06020 [Thermoanaerobaculia bacterium]|nr:hypothetical protein [Thermoanaerobaculia bacterium]
MRPTVREILADHVSLEVSCVDRIYVNGYVPKLQTSGQLVFFLSEHLGFPLASPAILGRMGDHYRAKVRRFVKDQEIPVVRFQRSQRKDEVASDRRRKHSGQEGVVFLGTAQERFRSFKGQKRVSPAGVISFDFSRQAVFVNQLYFYVRVRPARSRSHRGLFRALVPTPSLAATGICADSLSRSSLTPTRPTR